MSQFTEYANRELESFLRDGLMGYMVLLHRENILLTRVEAAIPVES